MQVAIEHLDGGLRPIFRISRYFMHCRQTVEYFGCVFGNSYLISVPKVSFQMVKRNVALEEEFEHISRGMYPSRR